MQVFLHFGKFFQCKKGKNKFTPVLGQPNRGDHLLNILIFAHMKYVRERIGFSQKKIKNFSCSKYVFIDKSHKCEKSNKVFPSVTRRRHRREICFYMDQFSWPKNAFIVFKRKVLVKKRLVRFILG
jgi:hypothetical protein